MSTNFSIQFLGTGNARSKPPANFNTNALLRIHDKACLIDCGLLCPLALNHYHIPITSIDGVFISHIHGDHVLGLEELFFTNYFNTPSRRLQLFLPEGLLKSTGAPDGYDLWENCLRASLETTVEFENYCHKLTLSDYAKIQTLISHSASQIFGLTCETFPVVHIKNRPSYGIILDNRVAYTSDCTFSQESIQTLIQRGISTLFHDVCFAPKASSVHASIQQLATLPPEIRQKIYLMHYDDKTSAENFKFAESLGFHIIRPGDIFEF